MNNFERAFRAQGYQRCSAPDADVAFEKVAIYVDANNVPTHASRQLETGEWASKLGKNVDIIHDTPEAVGGFEGRAYGRVALLMRRPRH